MSIKDHGDCPKCGYPSKGQYLGMYRTGYRCDGCGYIDLEAEAELLRKEAEKDVRVKKLRENPPVFKSAEDWEKWNQEEHLK